MTFLYYTSIAKVSGGTEFSIPDIGLLLFRQGAAIYLTTLAHRLTEIQVNIWCHRDILIVC